MVKVLALNRQHPVGNTMLTVSAHSDSIVGHSDPNNKTQHCGQGHTGGAYKQPTQTAGTAAVYGSEQLHHMMKAIHHELVGVRGQVSSTGHSILRCC